MFTQEVNQMAMNDINIPLQVVQGLTDQYIQGVLQTHSGCVYIPYYRVQAQVHSTVC